MDVDEIAERLYALPLEEFTEARDDAARDADSPDLRKAVKALRKPTAAAHEVNRIVRMRPADVDALLDLGERMRAAMGRDAAEVRRLTEERRDLVSGLIDRNLTASVQEDVSATLEAATADPDLGAAVRSGRLVKPLRYVGFGALPDLTDVIATRSMSPAATKSPAKKPEPPKPEAPKADLAAARDRVLELSGIADDAQRRYETAVKSATEARRVLDAAEAERAEAHKAARAAHAEAEKARRDLGRLERS
ncbi:MAG TPA: hypothetical protein VH274_02115 [Mycobacteriales bacterium]|nr:hypothetical protein [Mycobacteriales bacterium]